jgi:23S rRNA (guanine2445-N2)-methyltransferase / 23S rRNA (guanine2069-N7)-methyltransferase
VIRLFATTARGCESALADELSRIGATRVSPRPSGVAFEGDLATAYRACLWSRTASRILMELGSVEAGDPDRLCAAVGKLPWEEHMDVSGTLAVAVTRSPSAKLTHTQYVAQRVKDGIVDRFRDRTGERPSVDLDRPDLRIAVHLNRDRATVSLDLSGEALHRRGYRGPSGAAPLKENLAAAALWRAGWGPGGSGFPVLLDPMCGSGTFLIEAAHMAADVAPGLSRSRFGFHGWLGHDAALWDSLVSEAMDREEVGWAALERERPRLIGYDEDPVAVSAARHGVAAAQLDDWIEIEQLGLHALIEQPAPAEEGLLITNPPWGERMGDEESVAPIFGELGNFLEQRLSGWKGAVLTGNPRLGLRMGLEARKRYAMQDGPIECQLLIFDPGKRERRAQARRERGPKPLSEGAQAFANRLRKRAKSLRKWAAKQPTECYRVYDADLPEFAIAVDIYGSWVHVQEYAPPETIDPSKAASRLREGVRAIAEVLEVPREQIVVKRRERQRGRAQYEKLDRSGEELQVREGPARFLINLHDHLDTGLFLDHRSTRAMVRELAAGKHFLNLYAYTGTATVHAALGGAESTTSVDLSRTYLDWARRNLALNGFEGPEHVGVRADCRTWLRSDRGRYDLIFLDPPTFSNTKGLEDTLDIQRDHVELIRLCVDRLNDDGMLLFSTNSRRFRLDEDALSDLEIQDISRKTLPHDFERNPRIHRAFRITRRRDSAD